MSIGPDMVIPCVDCPRLKERIVKLEAENERLKERYRDYERLWEIADRDTCGGDCDLNPPHERCPECAAKRTINECGEIRDYALRDIEQALPGGKDS